MDSGFGVYYGKVTSIIVQLQRDDRDVGTGGSASLDAHVLKVAVGGAGDGDDDTDDNSADDDDGGDSDKDEAAAGVVDRYDQHRADHGKSSKLS